MKRKLLLILTILILFVSAAINPMDDDAETFQIKFSNETLNDIEVVLENDDEDGPDYQFTVKAYKSTAKSIEEGTYTMEWKECGKDRTVSITVTEDMVWNFDECYGQPIPIKFIVNNHQDQTIEIELTSLNDEGLAKEDYVLKAKFGVNRFQDLWSGFYIFSYEACDSTFSGVVHIEGGGRSSLTIKSCERLVYEDFNAPVPVKARIANHFSVPVDITLLGPLGYIETLSPGMNRLQLVTGTYHYIYAAHGVRYEGIWVVEGGGASYLAVPYFIPERAE